MSLSVCADRAADIRHGAARDVTACGALADVELLAISFVFIAAPIAVGSSISQT
jgi:hypothetical protein